jgi:hypothetical protein
MMSRTLLLLAGVAVAIAGPSAAHGQGQAQLASPPSGSGATRTLVCHGGPGIQVRVHADPSPSWTGPATYPTKPVRMALHFAGRAPIARLADAANLPAGSCAWIDWDSRFGAPPQEAYVDVNAAASPAPNPASVGAALADAKRFYLFPARLGGDGPIASYRGEWIPGATSQATGPLSEMTTTSGVPSIRQLMCRGGPSGFEYRVIADPSPAYPGTPRYVRVAMRYRVHAASDTAEPAIGSMSPGSCGWDKRFGAPEPPGEVIIDIQTDAQAANAGLGIPRDTSARAGLSYPDTASLRRYLSEPAHFWIFYHPDRGEPLAMSHGAHKPDLTGLFDGPVREARTTASGTRATAAVPVTSAPAPAPLPTGSGPGGARTSRTLLPDVRIWGVATAPGPRGVRLAFNTDRTSTSFGTNGIGVQFSGRRPPWDSVSGRWAYPPGWDSPWYADVSRPAQGGYLAEPRANLEVRQPYYYLITVESRDASLPARQVVGSFIASNNPFANAPPAPGPDPASNDGIGEPLRGDATDVAGTLRDQPSGSTTATGTTARPRGTGAAQSTGPATSRTPLPPDVRIWNIETKPGNSGVKLSFQTDRVWERSSSGVRVQFSTQQPRWEGGLLVSPAVDSRAREVVSGWFEAEPHWSLQPGKRHYYLITVSSNDGSLRPRQATGSFVPAFGQ